MAGDKRFIIWVHRSSKSIFGPYCRPANQDGYVLGFEDEQHALAECARLNVRSGDPYARYSVQTTAP